jgi:hypothetical protein
MRGVSKRIVNVAAVGALALSLLTQPVLAAAKIPPKDGYFETLIKKIVRVLDLGQIGFPPG